MAFIQTKFWIYIKFVIGVLAQRELFMESCDINLLCTTSSQSHHGAVHQNWHGTWPRQHLCGVFVQFRRCRRRDACTLESFNPPPQHNTRTHQMHIDCFLWSARVCGRSVSGINNCKPTKNNTWGATNCRHRNSHSQAELRVKGDQPEHVFSLFSIQLFSSEFWKHMR